MRLLPVLDAVSSFEVDTLDNITLVVGVMHRLSLLALTTCTETVTPNLPRVLQAMNSRISIQWSALPMEDQMTYKLNTEEAKNNIAVVAQIGNACSRLPPHAPRKSMLLRKATPVLGASPGQKFASDRTVFASTLNDGGEGACIELFAENGC